MTMPRTNRTHRGMTLLEVLVVIGVGGIVTALSFALLWEMGKASRRTDARLGRVESMEMALGRLELECAFMLPATTGGFDLGREAMENEMLRLWSTRFVMERGTVELVALAIEPANDDSGPKLERQVIGPDDKVLERETLATFPEATRATMTLESVGAKNGLRPSQLLATLRLTDAEGRETLGEMSRLLVLEGGAQ